MKKKKVVSVLSAVVLKIEWVIGNFMVYLKELEIYEQLFYPKEINSIKKRHIIFKYGFVNSAKHLHFAIVKFHQKVKVKVF